MNDRTQEHRGGINTARMLQQLVDSGTGRHNVVVAALRQMIENSLDAGATEIRIAMNRGESIRVADNGTGMTRRDIGGVNRLFTEHKEPGAGYGKNNSGRLFSFALAKKVRYWFISADYPSLHTIPFGWDEAIAVIENRLQNPPVKVAQAPAWWKMKSQETGTVVELTEVDWTRVKKVDDLRQQLSRSLSPWAADCVFVDDERLPRRETVKEWSYTETHPELGEIRGVFMKLASKAGKADGIFLGKNPICSIGDFMANLTDISLRALVPDWMEGTTLTGYLDIREVNKFAHHDRNKLQDEFYRNEALVRALMTFLNGLARKLEGQFSLRETQTQAAASADVMSNIASLLRPGTPTNGVDEGTTVIGPAAAPNENPIILSPNSVEMVVGTDQTFVIRRGPSDGVWDDKSSGGTITVTQRRGVNFRAGNKPGKYKLTYFSADMAQSGAVEIEILASAPFQISKRMVSTHANHQFQLYVLNCDSPTVTWEINTPDITLRPDADPRGVTVFVTERCTPAPLPGTAGLPNQGFYKLKAQGSGGEEAEATIVVRPFRPDVIEIDGTLYTLKKGYGGRMVEVTPQVRRDRLANLSVTLTDPLLVEARKKGPGAEMIALLAGMTAAHLAATSGEGNGDFERIMQELLTRVPDATKK